MVIQEKNRDNRSSTLKPFTHKFETDNSKYILDVNTGDIFRVDEVVWEIIEDSYQSETELIAKYTPHFTPDQISKAYQEISDMRAESGFFLNDHPVVAMPYTREQIHHLLTSQRGQLCLQVTEKCNFACSYCERNIPIAGRVPVHGNQDMSWEIARAAIDDFLIHSGILESENEDREHAQPSVSIPDELNMLKILLGGLVHVSFYGGEPLLNFSLIKKCCEYIREKTNGNKKVILGMTTNGYLLKGDIAEFVGAHKFSLMVSLDGPVSLHDQHRKTAQGAPTHHVVMENLRSFLRKYPNQLSAISAVVAPGTDPREVHRYFASATWLPPTVKVSISLAAPPVPGYWETPGVEEFPGNSAVFEDFKDRLIRGRVHLDIPGREHELIRTKFNKMFDGVHRRRGRISVLRQISKPYNPSGACVMGAERIHVSATGEYYPCEKVSKLKMYQIGSTATGMDEEKVYHLLQEFIECTRSECEQCWCVAFCTIGCHATVYDLDGFSVDTKRRACEETRGSLGRCLEEYCSILEQNPRAFDYLNSPGVPVRA